MQIPVGYWQMWGNDKSLWGTDNLQIPVEYWQIPVGYWQIPVEYWQYMWSTDKSLWSTDKSLWGTDKSLWGIDNICGVQTNPCGVLTMSTRWLTMFWTHSSTVSLPAFSVTSGSSGDSYIWSTPVNPIMYRVLCTLQILKLRVLSPTLSLHQTFYKFSFKEYIPDLWFLQLWPSCRGPWHLVPHKSQWGCPQNTPQTSVPLLHGALELSHDPTKIRTLPYP